MIAQFDISVVDPRTYTIHKGKYVDVAAFTEAVCRDDASVEASLKAALFKGGSEEFLR